jgi:secreted PhoX family phosphatase
MTGTARPPRFAALSQGGRMTDFSTIDRRTFLRRGAMGAGALWAVSLDPFMARRAHGAAILSPYGEIQPAQDQTTGLWLLKLPPGFQYWSFSWTGDIMADGVRCPNLHDGMAVVDVEGNSGHLILVRNHESGAGGPYVQKRSITYANDGAGGTTNLIFDARHGRWMKAWSSLAGTIRNCAGGVTPWGTWITGEETLLPGHGWSFDVGAQKGDPTPLVDMGRFSHEAMMVDPVTGYVYETEDATPSGFYRFVPNVPGKLAAGGELFMLKVKNQNNFDFGPVSVVGTTWDVQWVPIADPAATILSPYAQGAAAPNRGAQFRRLEGCWWGDQTGYFLSTNGGPAGEGQVFEYNPAAETVRLIYVSPAASDLDNPDNITVTPRGGLLLCEDAAPDLVVGERLVGLTLDGNTFTFAQNDIVLTTAYNDRVPPGNYVRQEWAGACYSPDGRWLFANIQTPGVTFAITGPWGAGPL